MAKVAYNNCYGGFSLSRAAVLRARELSGNPKWGNVNPDYGHLHDLPRHDPVLIQVIEEMGASANGSCASLAILEIPSGSKYRIDEYEGIESVETPDSYEWITAP